MPCRGERRKDFGWDKADLSKPNKYFSTRRLSYIWPNRTDSLNDFCEKKEMPIAASHGNVN